MAHHQLPEYDDQSDNWKAYITKVEAYFEATGVSDSGKKRALLVAALSTRTVQVLSGQVAPRKPNSLTYEEAVKVLDAYFDPKRHEITESYRFFNRCQLEDEPIQQFIVEVRIADGCNFGDMLDRMLRDRIVCGEAAIPPPCIPELGLIYGHPVHLKLKEGNMPKFCKARSLPYDLRDKVSKEIDRLVTLGVLSPVTHAEWATPIVPVMKNGEVRICVDFKVTLNPVCELEQYPFPAIDDIFACLNGGDCFSTLDLRDAYNQVPLDEDSRKTCVINTHRGLFCYNRLPFGIASAPAIFQRKIETVLQGLTGVKAYLDDVLVSEKLGSTDRLRQVLQRFLEHGVKLRLEKCSFRQEAVTYLGHKIDREGLHPIEKHVGAIAQAPNPQNVQHDSWPLPLPEATVYARNFGRGKKWTPGIVESTTGSRVVSIRTPAGSVRRHVDQVRNREDATPPFGKDQEAAKRDSRTGTPSDYPLLPRTPAEQGGITEPEHELQPELAGSNAEPVRSPQALRRSTRQRKPVQRLHY
ncbi:uncharacterized protein LOC144129492 [Amblyomma americanum]